MLWNINMTKRHGEKCQKVALVSKAPLSRHAKNKMVTCAYEISISCALHLTVYFRMPCRDLYVSNTFPGKNLFVATELVLYFKVVNTFYRLPSEPVDKNITRILWSVERTRYKNYNKAKCSLF